MQTKQTKEVEMNADKMTKEEFVNRVFPFIPPSFPAEYNRCMEQLWARIEAIQSAPFVPDWSLAPENAEGFFGMFVEYDNPDTVPAGEFFMKRPAPSHDEKAQMVGEGVSRNDEPFHPDWSLKPEWAKGFRGVWVPSLRDPGVYEQLGEFYIAAPSNPTDAELSAMWEKLDRDKRVQILRDAGVVV